MSNNAIVLIVAVALIGVLVLAWWKFPNINQKYGVVANISGIVALFVFLVSAAYPIYNSFSNPESDLSIWSKGNTEGIYIVTGEDIGDYSPGDNLIVYGVTNAGIDIPIGLVRVVAENSDHITVQAILSHPNVPIEPNLKLDNRVDQLNRSELVPAYSSAVGYYLGKEKVRLRPSSNLQKGDVLQGLNPQIIDKTIVDYLSDQAVEMQISEIGSEGKVAQVKIISEREPQVGTTLKLKDSALIADSTKQTLTPTYILTNTPTSTVGPTKNPEKIPTLTLTSTPTSTSTPTLTGTPTAILSPQPTLEAGSTRVSPNDEMVQLFIPSGEFRMGNTDEEIERFCEFNQPCSPSNETIKAEKPAHSVYLDAFWMDQTEITIEQYTQCVEKELCDKPSELSNYNDPNLAKHPVIFVNWEQARTYCESVGRRLPTEAEWEKAARGVDGFTFPWGDNKIDCNTANYGPDSKKNIFCVGDGETVPVGSYSSGASPYGVLDMSGNVWEWVSDWYQSDYYQSQDAINRNPQGPNRGAEKVLRSGSWGSYAVFNRATYRNKTKPTTSQYHIGFRCAQNASQ